MSIDQTPDPSLDQTTTAWLIEEILVRIDTQLFTARLDIDEVLRLAAQELPKEVDATFTEMIAELAEKTAKLTGFFADIPTISDRSFPSGDEQEDDEEDEDCDAAGAKTEPLDPSTKQSYTELAATDARTYAMIVLAVVSNAINYGETVAPMAVERVEDAIGKLQQTLRIITSGDPDAE